MSNETEWVLVPREPTLAMVDAWRDAPNVCIKAYAAMLAAAPQPPADAQPCGCGEATCTVPWEPGCGLGKSEQHAEAQAQGVGEALEAELIALVAGPYHYHHKMDEHAEREGKSFDRCRELTIQNIRTWCATRRAMLAAQPPSAPVGVEGLVKSWERSALVDALTEGERAVLRNCTRALRSIAQQPAADGGFSAADMMDARSEGRQEGQQSAGFSAGDMADAAAQGFRDGVARVGAVGVEAVEEALQRWLDWCDEHGEQPEAASGARIALSAALSAQPGGSDNG